MKDKSRNDKLNKYIEKFFPVLTQGKELKISNSGAIINNCVIIEDKKFFAQALVTFKTSFVIRYQEKFSYLIK